jgi:hypothetical protein
VKDDAGEMQRSQFLLNTRQADHPSHNITSRPPGPRPSMKSTLQHRFTKDIEQFTNNGVIFPSDYKKAVKKVHTNTVASALEKKEPNLINLLASTARDAIFSPICLLTSSLIPTQL